MKKILSLISLALFSVAALADGITSLGELQSGQAYYIRLSGQGYLYANGGRACTDGKTDATADAAHQWAVARSEKLGAYFLFNLQDGAFLSTADGLCPLTEAAQPVYLLAANDGGAWYAYINSGVVGQSDADATPATLAFEPAATTLTDEQRTRFEAAQWLAVTQQTAVPVISDIATRATSLDQLTDGLTFLLYSTGMSRYAYDQGGSLTFGSSQPAKNNITVMPYVFTLHKTGDTYTISTGIDGNYISGLSGSTVSTGTTPATFTITASSTAGSFNLYNAASSQYLNAQAAKPVGWGENEGNSRYQLLPVTLTNSDKYYPVTYICYETDGTHRRLLDVQTYAKTTNRLTAPTFSGYKRLAMNAEDGVSPVVTAVTGPTVVYVTYERTLRSQPVVSTTIADGQFADTTRWYRLRVNDRYLQYQPDARGHYYLYNTERPTFTDTDLWCFTGNNVDGYRLYNRAAGTAHSLTLKGEPQSTDLPFIQQGDVEQWAISNGSGTSWYVAPVGTQQTVYLADDGQRKLSVMGTAAPVYIDEAAAEMAALAAEAAANTGTNVGQIDATADAASALADALDAYNASVDGSGMTQSAFDGLQTAYNAFIADATRVGFEDGRLYRFVSQTDDATVLAAAIDATTAAAEATDADARSQMWRVLPVGNTGAYYLLNPENGNFLGQASGTRAVTLLAAPTTHSYTLATPAPGTWTVRDAGTSGTSNYLNLTDAGLTSGKGTEATALWSIAPVTTFTVTTQGVAGADVAAATVCLPFSVALPADATAAAITAKGEASVTIESLDGNVVPAHTPVLLITDQPRAVTLVAEPSAATDAPAANLLLGVAKRTVLDDASAAYVLDGTPQFVASDGTLPAYTAYLDRAFTDAAALALTLPTGIDGVTMAGGQSSITYDLQGRPVARPLTPGVFIRNGVKVVVK
ncbi:MAG: hypothetical protein J6M53_06945 [Bacteroidaceae bacterium]|nr:hypothetical protein [Bacteroidaceae bacterium]